MKIDPTLPLSEKRAIAGRIGGRRTLRRHGKRHMKRLAEWGAHALHSLYRMEPVLLNDFAFVCRKTGTAVALLSGRPLDSVHLPKFAPDLECDVDQMFA